MLERSESPAQRILRPALRIALRRVLKEAVECREQVRKHCGQLEFADEVRTFGDDEVVPLSERLAQRFYRGVARLLAKRIQSRELFFKLALAGHECSVSRRQSPSTWRAPASILYSILSDEL